MKLKLKNSYRWDILCIIAILTASACLLYIYSYENVTYTKAQIANMFEPITSKYGIKIVYQINNHFFSDLVNPIAQAGPDPHSKVTPIRDRVLARYPGILQKALAKYPVDVIKKYLKGIYFASEINQHGLEYGGSYDPFRHIIYIVDNGDNSEDDSIGTFHHEFSSLLLCSHSFYINPWTDINPQNFNYLYDVSKNTLKTYNNTSTDGTKSDYEKGFMDTYGETDFENDFNEYARIIFTYPDKFKRIMNKYPRVHAKFLIFLKFYHKIDPVFTESYLLGKN